VTRRFAPVMWICCGILAVVIAGCHAPGAHPGPANPDREATLLKDIPIPPLPPAPAAPTTSFAPATAIRFYVDGRSELLAGKGPAAVDDLTKAAAADPNSKDVLYDLGRAEEVVGNSDAAIDAYDRATAIDPTAVAPQLAAGRLLQTAGRSDAAIDHLHRALNSPKLVDDGQGVAVHLWLARALGSAGYVVAAVDQFNIVIDRLNNPTSDLRNEPSILDVLRRPLILDLDRADLLESQQRYDLAIQILERSAEAAPDDAEVAGRLVTDLIKTNVAAEAVERAGRLVVAAHASTESLAVLGKACAATIPPVDETDQLLKIAAAHPADTGVRAAAIAALTRANRTVDALAFVTKCHAQFPADPSVTTDLVRQLLRAARPVDAFKAVIDTASADPDAVDRLEPSWAAITRPGRRTLLNPDDVMRLTPDGARDWYLSRLLDDLHRKGDSAKALADAVSRRPVFPPAFRTALDRIDQDLRETPDWKQAHADELARTAEAGGAPWLSAELHGIALLDAGNPALASKAIAAARQLNPNSAEVRFQSAKVAGSPVQVEFALWQNITDFPTFVGSYRALATIYLAGPVAPRDELEQLAATWSANLPDDFGGPLLQVRLAADRGDDAEAEKILSGLIDLAPNDATVFDAARAFYSRIGKLESLARRLQSRLETRPRDVPVVAEVVTLFTSLNRSPEAIRVLDASRTAMAGDPTGLYPLANLYSKAGESATAVELLRDVIKLDPNFAAACNDLAFYLIDQGKDLAEAGELVARALKLEPDNPAFLDSLGWLQYKWGDFNAAADTLRKAVGPAVGGEATVLDHFGDALNKSGQPDEAKKVWARGLTALGTKPDEQPALRLQLLQKISKR
jgi:tetratricopeptide (TPR) repeat protein